MKVVLDLPVIGDRTLDQELSVPIQEGSLDYRALEDSLNWLEGAFLDIKHDGRHLALVWKVPIFGVVARADRWTLDQDAATLAAFGRVPVRSLADFRDRRSRARRQEAQDPAVAVARRDRHRAVAARAALRRGRRRRDHVRRRGPARDGRPQGHRLDQRPRPGDLKGAIGSVDTTIKDVQLGPVKLTADRLHFDGLDELEVVFDGFRPANVMVLVHRVTATNLSLSIGR